MRRIGVHRVFLPTRSRLLSYQVVTVSDGGEVTDCVPLSREQAATEWWGGLLVVAPDVVERLSDESFEDFCRRLSDRYATASESICPLRAFHVSPFDAAALQFTPDSRLRPVR